MRTLFLVTLVTLLFACKGRQTSETEAIDAQAAIYHQNPNDSTATALINVINQYIDAHGHADSATARFVLLAARVSEERNQLNQALGYYKMYLTENPTKPDHATHLASIITILDRMNKAELNQVLYRSFVSRFPNDQHTSTYSSKIERKEVGIDSLLKEYGIRMFNDSIYRLDENIARLYVDASEAAVMAQPDLPNAPEYLHRAAETARTLRDIPKAISLYDWIINRYGDTPRGATALFLKAFTYDNDLKDFEKARTYYEEFLAKHPNNEFAESAKFLLENLGKSDEQLRQIIEEKKEGK